MPATSLGAMREQLVIQTSTPSTISVSSLTRSGNTATATTASAHGFATGDYVTTAGATPSGYNGRVKVTVTTSTTLTYQVNSGLSTPATGTITVAYSADAQGHPKQTWRTLATVFAEQMALALRGAEQLQAGAITAQLDYRFRTHVRADVTEKMRVLWTPTYPTTSSQRTLEIHAVLSFGDGRTFMVLACGRAA